mmetsp:Transcript_10718/g.39350  ORF Transcript_10718/g.39350 Transcript_10718/m.39350 type:complete len:200 (+) Transcript_10718:3539-4138(+)
MIVHIVVGIRVGLICAYVTRQRNVAPMLRPYCFGVIHSLVVKRIHALLIRAATAKREGPLPINLVGFDTCIRRKSEHVHPLLVQHGWTSSRLPFGHGVHSHVAPDVKGVPSTEHSREHARTVELLDDPNLLHIVLHTGGVHVARDIHLHEGTGVDGTVVLEYKVIPLQLHGENIQLLVGHSHAHQSGAALRIHHRGRVT